MALIGLTVNNKDKSTTKDAYELMGWLRGQGHELFVDILRDGEFDLSGTSPLAESANLDLAISFGGDGSMLYTVNAVAEHGVPVLGVNYGQLGYLVEVAQGKAQEAVENFFKGEFHIEERMRLTATQKSSSGQTHTFNALNEVLISKKKSGHTIRLGLRINGKPFTTYEADGLILATSTGSTAYSLSAGGPIVEPELETIIITPVAPHMLFDRSLILPPNDELAVEILGDHPAELNSDGAHHRDANPKDTILISRNSIPACLVRFGERDFRELLRDKFGLTDR